MTSTKAHEVSQLTTDSSTKNPLLYRAYSETSTFSLTEIVDLEYFAKKDHFSTGLLTTDFKKCSMCHPHESTY